MKVGICFPMTMDPARQRDIFQAWCSAVDESNLSTIALGERIAYQAQDPLIALAVASGVTQRVRLMTSVVVLPLRNTGMIAKAVASLDVLSGGRLILGVGIGNRPEDYQSLDVSWRDRAQRIETQIQSLRSIWRGEAITAGTGPIGPAPASAGGPPVIYGATTPVALQRAGRIADGIITWSIRPDPQAQRASIRTVTRAWQDAGRSGRPYIVAAMYFALGPQAEETLRSHLTTYYSYSPEARKNVYAISTYTEQAVADAIKTYAEAGVDELLFGPPSSSVDQIKYLADVVARLAPQRTG